MVLVWAARKVIPFLGLHPCMVELEGLDRRGTAEANEHRAHLSTVNAALHPHAPVGSSRVRCGLEGWQLRQHSEQFSGERDGEHLHVCVNVCIRVGASAVAAHHQVRPVNLEEPSMKRLCADPHVIVDQEQHPGVR